MKTRAFVTVLVPLLAAGSTASADPAPSTEVITDASEIAPRNALEIGVQAGFTQPFGEIEQGRSFGDLVDAGGAVALELAYRVSPRWGVGWSAHFHESTVDPSFTQDHDVRGVSASSQVTYHGLPFERYDPYISFGAGYRFLWVVPEGPEESILRRRLSGS